MNRRSVILVVVVFVAMAATVDTGAFSATSVDRGVQVDVTSDERAFLGVSLATTDVANGTTNLTVTVKNQFPPGTTLTAVTVDTNNGTQRLATPSDPLRPGESTTVTVQNATCGDAVIITGTNSATTVRLHRTIDCR